MGASDPSTDQILSSVQKLLWRNASCEAVTGKQFDSLTISKGDHSTQTVPEQVLALMKTSCMTKYSCCTLLKASFGTLHSISVGNTVDSLPVN